MRTRLALAAALALWPALASAQFAVIAPTPAVTDNGDRIATTAWVNSFFATGLPLANGKIFIGSAGGLATQQTMSGDCTLSATGVITCTQSAGNFLVNGSLTVSGTLIDGNGQLLTNIAAPATPGAGTTRVYADSTQKILTAKNDAGVVSNTVVPSTCGANLFGTSISAAGIFGCTQPAFSNLSGTSGISANVLNSVTANYTIATTDCGKTIQAGTGTTGLFTITIPAVAGFATTCDVVVVNGDTTRGKAVAGAGLPSNLPGLLFPQQSFTIRIVNGAWAATRLPGRWKTASGALTINTDFTNGNDANDGLATGSGNALKTVEGALSVISNYLDLNGTGSPTQVTILMAAGSTDSQGVHQSFHSFVGANGGAAVKVDGNGGSITTAVQLYFGTVIQFRNITFSNAAGNCLQVFWGAKAYILDAVTFGACTGAQVQVASGAGHLEFINNFTITGSSGFFIIADTGASVQATAAITGSFSTTATYTYFVLSASPAYTNLQSVTWNLNGHTVTAQKANIQLNGVLLQSTATLAVTGAVSGTGAVCRLTMASTASLAESQRVIVAAIAGATGCNVTAAVHIVDGTHIELTGTTFGGAYTSGGTVQIGLPGTTDPATSTGGQVL